VPLAFRRIRLGVLAVGIAAGGRFSYAQEALDVGRYVEIVKKSHPAASERAGLERAAAAEKRASRVLPDPVFGFEWDRARPTDLLGAQGDETGYAFSQTLPWPGTRRAGIAAGDRASEVLLANAEGVGWEIEARARLAFARLETARGLTEVARGAEEDARSLRDLVARRAELGESRESDRIKVSVEWLRQQRELAAVSRQAQVAEAILRALAVQPLPQPLVLKPTAHPPLPPFDASAVAARLAETNPRLRAARAEAARREALSSVARRSRIPDLDVSVFRLRELDKEANGFSVGIKLPLWNANRGEIARAEAEQGVAAAAAARERIDVLTELEARLTDLMTAADQTALLEREILPQATRSLDLARLLYEEGETSLLDLLDAQRTFREAQRERVESHLAQAFAVADVQRLAGPDFDPWRLDR
jgi:cobalt-zinc-cadmium efflux system outer membrane protein